ncbi:MAG: purine nucleoside phosphorylase [Methylibium sp. NZG]|nr:MAG: purine nucleoside phosphorylase [Methylibium sp. NZG]
MAQLHSLAPGACPRIAIVLGSGWGGATAHISGAQRIAYTDLPGFPQPGVGGHSGELWLGHIGPHEVAVMSGRQHAYETGAVDGMKLPLRTLRELGCEVLVQTNAAGSTDAAIRPGSLMLVADHLNLPQRSPLVGEAGAERFVGMANAYDAALRAGAHAVARERGTVLHEGVYAWFLGPQFETPAEIRMAQRLGAQAVGMSTVPETILARHAGMRVLAISLITNMAAGLSDEDLSHAHTLAQAGAASEAAGALLAAIIAGVELPASRGVPSATSL